MHAWWQQRIHAQWLTLPSPTHLKSIAVKKKFPGNSLVMVLGHNPPQRRLLTFPSPDGEAVDLVLGEVTHQNIAQLHVVAVHLLQSRLRGIRGATARRHGGWARRAGRRANGTGTSRERERESA